MSLEEAISDGDSEAVSWCTDRLIVGWGLSLVQFEVWQLVVSAVWILEPTGSTVS